MDDQNVGQQNSLPGMPVGALNPLDEAQRRSAAARCIFEVSDDAEPWLADYFDLIAEGYSWRQAIYLLWSAQPVEQREPRTQQELATRVLGLTSDRVISDWNQNPAMEARRAGLVRSVIQKSLPDVFQALVDSARNPSPRSHSDRRLLLEMAGEYTPKQMVRLSADDADEFEQMDEAELRKIQAGPENG